MLDIKFIRENPQKVTLACQNKNITADVDAFLALDTKRREILINVENLRASHNKVGKDNIELGKKIKEQIKIIEPEWEDITRQWKSVQKSFPNIPFEDVPVGKDDSQNVVLKKVGKIPTFDFPIKDHIQLGEALDLIDIKSAAAASGARFYYLKNEGALLEMALVHFAFEVLTKKSFSVVIPPVLLGAEAATGT